MDNVSKIRADTATSTGMMLPDRPFTTKQARALGLKKPDLIRLTRAGLLRHPFRAVYCPSQLPDDLVTRAACARLVLPPHVVVADRSAAWLHGVDCLRHFETTLVPPLEVVSVVGLPTRRRGMYGGERDLQPDETTAVGGVPLTTPVRTAVDLASLRGAASALAALEAMMRVCQLAPADLERQLRRHKGRRGVIQARRLVSLASASSESPGESMTKWYLVEAGFPCPVAQFELVLRGWGAVRLDLSYPTLKIAIEYDGEEFHGPEQSQHDRKRREALREVGWLVIVVQKEDLAADARPGWIAEVRDAFVERAPEYRRTFPRSVSEFVPRRRRWR